MWGHLRYHEARNVVGAAIAYPADAPQPVGVACRLQSEVVPALRALIAAARADGHRLVAASCFRSLDAQVDVFYGPIGPTRLDEKALKDRADESAPPGFSEHHTGYAVDFCDGATPATCTDLNPGFAQTKAGRWLLARGAAFGFEMSFPKGDDDCSVSSRRPMQGLAYEPWHWRYAGSATARQVFARARARFPVCPKVAKDVPVASLAQQLENWVIGTWASFGQWLELRN